MIIYIRLLTKTKNHSIVSNMCVVCRFSVLSNLILWMASAFSIHSIYLQHSIAHFSYLFRQSMCTLSISVVVYPLRTWHTFQDESEKQTITQCVFFPSFFVISNGWLKSLSRRNFQINQDSKIIQDIHLRWKWKEPLQYFRDEDKEDKSKPNEQNSGWEKTVMNMFVPGSYCSYIVINKEMTEKPIACAIIQKYTHSVWLGW